MIEWYNKIDTIRGEDFLPRLLLVAGETVDGEEYYYDNSTRKDKPHLVFKYTLEGQGIFERRNVLYNLEPGTLFFTEIPSTDTKYYYPADGTQSWRFVYCCFNGDMVFKLCREIAEKYGNIFHLSPKEPVIMKLREFENHQGEAISAAAGADFIMRLILSLIESRSQTRSYNNFIIDKAIKFISENLSKQINVSEVSDALDVSREHLTRIFSQYLNTTPRKYIENERIYAALKLLQNTSLSSKTIAYKCGFSSPSQFGRVFRRLLNETPETYRKKGTVAAIFS